MIIDHLSPFQYDALVRLLTTDYLTLPTLNPTVFHGAHEVMLQSESGQTFRERF